MYSVNAIISTNGIGYWSNVAKPVTVTGFDVPYINKDDEDDGDGDFGELRVYFDTASWDVNKDGLIYTDRQFIVELRQFLSTLGLAGNDVEYSEQGMQGDDYVSLDVGKEFIDSFTANTHA